MEDFIANYGAWGFLFFPMIWVTTHWIADQGSDISVFGLKYRKPTKPSQAARFIVPSLAGILVFSVVVLWELVETKERSARINKRVATHHYLNLKQLEKKYVALRDEFCVQLPQLAGERQLKCSGPPALESHIAPLTTTSAPSQSITLGIAGIIIGLISFFGVRRKGM